MTSSQSEITLSILNKAQSEALKYSQGQIILLSINNLNLMKNQITSSEILIQSLKSTTKAFFFSLLATIPLGLTIFHNPIAQTILGLIALLASWFLLKQVLDIKTLNKQLKERLSFLSDSLKSAIESYEALGEDSFNISSRKHINTVIKETQAYLEAKENETK